jgi:Big-like domain-containing protein
VVAVVVGAALLTGGAANAAPPAGSLGSLTITPATGSDLTVPTARTSGPCPTSADSANMLITGPVGAADPIFPPDNPLLIAGTTSAAFSTTDAFDLPFSVSLKDAPKGKALQAGEYDLVAQCVNGLTQEVFGTFTGAMFFTSPTVYQTTDPNVGPTATTTTLDVTPASPVAAGTVKTLTATVSLPEAAGSVQFKAGDNNIGRPVAVSGGTASTKTRLAVGTHPLTAVFTPTDVNAFSGSTSNTVSYVVNVPTGAKATTTTPR